MHETATSRFFLEHPAAGQPLPAGRQLLRGWLAPKPGHHFVDLRARAPDGIHLAVLGHPRRDLAEAFGWPGPYLPGGFELALDLPPGETRLVFEACDLAGAWSPVAALAVTAGPPAAAATDAGTPAPFLAHEFARALLRLLRRRRAEPDRPLAELAAAVAAATPWPCAVRYPHRPFHGHLDEPAALARAGFGRLNVLGWLFHETAPIRRVWASCDLQVWQRLRHGGPFAGVRMRHPDSARADDCALEGLVDVPAQLPQPRCLRICAELADGSWHLAHVQRTWTCDREDEKLPLPRYSLWMFWEACRALRAAYVSAGVPLEAGPDRRRAVREIRRDFHARAPRSEASRSEAPTPPAAPEDPLLRGVADLSAEGLAKEGGRGVSSPAPRRVLLVTHNLNLEGAPLFLSEYARQLAAAGTTLAVVSGREGPLRARFEALGAAVRVLDLGRLPAAGSAHALRREIRALSAQVDWAGVELVVANTVASFWGVLAADAAGRPSLLYIHESAPPAGFFPEAQAPAVLPVVADAFARATRVSFLTTATRRYYDDLAVRSNFCVNPGWIDLAGIDAFRAAHPRAELRARLGAADDTRLVINVGSVCERKGQTIFARAVDLLCRQQPELTARARFLMIGGRDTLYDRDLADLLRDLALPNLQVLPETPEAYVAYGAADLFVCSSYEESFPRVLLEAMAFGVPVVSTDVHGIPEIARPGQEALLVPPGDTHALAAAMQRMLSDPAAAGELAARARRRVETTFTIDQILPGHLALARDLARR